jgi:deoxyribodipyrimidine photo-lyase
VSSSRSLVWFRGKDLRLADHRPLEEALRGPEAILVFVLDPYFFAAERAANLPHRMQFLLESLRALQQEVRNRGSELLVIPGRSVEVIPRCAKQWGVDRVLAYRWSEPFGRERDQRIARELDIPLVLMEGETLHEAGSVVTKQGTPYRVYTPFARALEEQLVTRSSVPAPQSLPPVPADVEAPTVPVPELSDLGLTHNPRLVVGGESHAQQRLDAFLNGVAVSYAAGRDRLGAEETSRLSADLKFGTLSVWDAWAALSRWPTGGAEGQTSFRRQLIWREFAYSNLWSSPHLLTKPFRSKWNGFPWEENGAGWDAWVAGQTGYPVVDAAARQLLAEGYVDGRARMISASFLCKHLLIDYRRGEAHYLKWLTDGDWAQNNLGWQWSAGCGCDAQPYFRIFNPMSQGKRFDPEGVYVRRWVPELRDVPKRWVHEPWEAPPLVLRSAGVTLGREYPRPIVDHRTRRERFLEVAKSALAS